MHEYRDFMTALAERVRDSVRPPAPPSSPEPAEPGEPPDPGVLAARALGPAGSRQPAEVSPTNARPPRHAAGRHVILFLAANPSETTRLALDEKCAAIEAELRMTTGRDDFDFRSKWAVSVDEMMRHLNELQPIVIHFSGHGGGSAGIYLRDEPAGAPAARHVTAASDVGIYLQDEHRQQQHVRARALTQMIASAAPSARLVVLNACFSDALAEELCRVVECIVGMRGAIGDVAARSFAVGFYRALGHRRSVGNAIEQAVATLAAKRLPDADLPICRTRDGINAAQVTLLQRQLHPP
jgi:hypothetical protein